MSVLSQVQGERKLELGVAAEGKAGSYQKVDEGAPFYWDWLKDSRAIVVHANLGQRGDAVERLSVLHIAGETARADLPFEAGLFQAPNVSPDGKSVAYASTTASGFILRLRALGDATERVLARDLGGAFFSFSADGKRLAYLAANVAEPIPLGRLTILDVQQSLAARTIAEAPVLGFFWSPDGKTLAYLIPPTSDDMDSMFAQDQGQLYLQLMGCDAATGRTWLIARFPPSKGLLDVLPFFDQYQRSASLWSPDGKHIVFDATTASGQPGLFVASADGSIKPRFLAFGDFAFWSPR